jgi:hypothetical protein
MLALRPAEGDAATTTQVPRPLQIIVNAASLFDGGRR